MKFVILNYFQTGKLIFILLEAQRSASGMLPSKVLQVGLFMQQPNDLDLNNSPVYQHELWMSPCACLSGRRKRSAEDIMSNSWHKKLTSSFQIIFHRPYITMENTAEQITRSWLFLRSTSFAFLSYNHCLLHQLWIFYINIKYTRQCCSDKERNTAVYHKGNNIRGKCFHR